MKNGILLTIFILFITSILLLALRGVSGNPTEQDLLDPKWAENGPFELSPDRGRFALLYSVVENKSFQFSVSIAQFATPDVAFTNEKYVSLFAPGVSFITIPGYLIGKLFGLAQVGTFAFISLIAVINVLLIRTIAIRLGAHPIAALIAGLAFIFATPAFSYAVSLYQHHISTFLILVSIYVLMRFKSVFATTIIWFIIGAAVAIDNPNLIFLAPIGIFAVTRFFSVEHLKETVRVHFKVLSVLTFIGVILPLALFLLFNQLSHGNALQLSGTLPTAKAIDEQGKPKAPETEIGKNAEFFEDPNKQQKTASGFFLTRNLLNGFYVHFLSSDRGMLYFAPVMFFGFAGLVVMRKKDAHWQALLIGVLGCIILLYSMWGDPWGGWAFGSRYFIPAYALLAIFIAILLTRTKNLFVILVFLLVFAYSTGVNTLGAITTNRNPPEGEAKALEPVTGRHERFSYDRNFEYLSENKSKSYIFQTYAYKQITAYQYFVYLTGAIIGFTSIFIVYLVLVRKRVVYET